MFSPAIRKLHLLHRRDKEDASASPPPATAAPFHSPSPRGFSVPDLVGSPSPTSRSPAPRPHGPPPPSYPDHGEMNFLDPYMTLQNKLWRQNTVSAKRHEGYQTLRQICYDISDTVPLRNLMRIFIPVLCLRVLRKILTSQATESHCPLLKDDVFSISLKLLQQQFSCFFCSTFLLCLRLCTENNNLGSCTLRCCG